MDYSQKGSSDDMVTVTSSIGDGLCFLRCFPFLFRKQRPFSLRENGEERKKTAPPLPYLAELKALPQYDELDFAVTEN